jgi:LacI family transcriptional regulator
MEDQHKSKRITIGHIAAAAGVSTATVSRALKDVPGTNPETKAKIAKIAAELNYRSGSQTVSARRRKTRTIGIIFNDLNNPFYTEALDEIGALLGKRKYSVIICPSSNYDMEIERRNILELVSRRVDGIIMSPADARSENLRILSEHDVETVLVDCFPHFEDKSYVYTDHRKGFKIAIEHLLNNGHREILFMISRQDKSLAEDLLGVYANTLEAYSVPFKKELVIYTEKMTIESGYKAFKSLLTEDIKDKFLDFTGIVAMNDLIALGVYKVANELGLDIPGTYSVVGYDNIEASSVVKPPLTTIHQSRIRIGNECVNALLHNVESGERNRKRICFEPYIVGRGSVRRRG